MLPGFIITFGGDEMLPSFVIMATMDLCPAALHHWWCPSAQLVFIIAFTALTYCCRYDIGGIHYNTLYNFPIPLVKL